MAGAGAPKLELELVASDKVGDDGPERSTRGALGIAFRRVEKDGALSAGFDGGGGGQLDGSSGRVMQSIHGRGGRSNESIRTVPIAVN